MTIVGPIDENVLNTMNIRQTFQNRGFTRKTCSDASSQALRRFWINVYARTTDYTITDAGIAFNFSKFKKKAACLKTLVSVVSTKALDHIGIVDRGHAYLELFLRVLYGFTKYA